MTKCNLPRKAYNLLKASQKRKGEREVWGGRAVLDRAGQDKVHWLWLCWEWLWTPRGHRRVRLQGAGAGSSCTPGTGRQHWGDCHCPVSRDKPCAKRSGIPWFFFLPVRLLLKPPGFLSFCRDSPDMKQHLKEMKEEWITYLTHWDLHKFMALVHGIPEVVMELAGVSVRLPVLFEMSLMTWRQLLPCSSLREAKSKIQCQP